MSLIFSGNFDLIEFECVLNLTTSSNFYCTVGESITASEPFYFISNMIFSLWKTLASFLETRISIFFVDYNLVCM